MHDLRDPDLKPAIVMQLLPGDAIAKPLAPKANEVTTFVFRRDQGTIRFDVPIAHYEDGDLGRPVVHPVVAGAVEYVRFLAENWPEASALLADGQPILFQCNDTPEEVRSISWERRRGWQSIKLIPDLYYFREAGYETFRPKRRAWRHRRDIVGWRGASTGMPGLTAEQLDNLPRYRLVKAAAGLGDKADVGFSSIVQAANPDEEDRIRTRLKEESLMKDYVMFERFADYRYIVDIGGNANAWNFMQKLRLGACILRVEDSWEQWFEDRLKPWHHFVPVARDLSDFAEKLDWCRANSWRSWWIARNGLKLALRTRFSAEMRTAALTIFSQT